MPEGWTKWTSAPPTCSSARWPSMRNCIQANSNLHWPWWQLGSHCRICELALHLAENFWYLAARIVKHNVIPKSIVEYLLCNWCQTFPLKRFKLCWRRACCECSLTLDMWRIIGITCFVNTLITLQKDENEVLFLWAYMVSWLKCKCSCFFIPCNWCLKN